MPDPTPDSDRRLADPTTVIVTDGTPEAEAAVMRARIEAARRLAFDEEDRRG